MADSEVLTSEPNTKIPASLPENPPATTTENIDNSGPSFKKKRRNKNARKARSGSTVNARKRNLSSLKDETIESNLSESTETQSNTNTDDNDDNALERRERLKRLDDARKKRRLNNDNNDESSNGAVLFSSKPTQFGKESSKQPIAAIHSFESERNVLPVGKSDQGATIDVSRTDNDAPKATIEKASELDSSGRELYRGSKNYIDPSKDQKARDVPKWRRVGPQTAPDNVKITCRFDYQPDICKDWKETGYCGYGMSCKFLHDRSDYKFGWQIENDWQKFETKRKAQLKGETIDDDDENYEIHSSDDSDADNIDTKDGLPFACFICRESFTNPVVTNCGHYFCESCAFDQFKKTPACACCGENTDGQFQTADKLIRKMKSLKKS